MLADPTRIRQLVMNLALNARDVMPAGGQLRFELVRLQIGAQEKLPLPDVAHGDWLQLRVGDTGTGIPPATLHTSLIRSLRPRSPAKVQVWG